MDASKLVPTVHHGPQESHIRTSRINMASFARIVTFDPNRNEGCRSNRIQEFRNEDVFLETDIAPATEVGYGIPIHSNGLGCIGLQWLEIRSLKEISFCYYKPPPSFSVDRIQVQGWVGESVWQGEWKPFCGNMQLDENCLSCHPVWCDRPSLPVQTQKIRWIFPSCDEGVIVKEFIAYTDATCEVSEFSIEHIGTPSDGEGLIEIYNGEMDTENGAPIHCRSWNIAQKTSLRVRHTGVRKEKSDRTVIRFRLPTISFGVSIEDVLTRECVWIPSAGVFLSMKSSSSNLDDYLRTIENRQTILQKVRELPDQTLSQAMEMTHHAIQDNGPMMLSLACDNSKFILQQDGAIQWKEYEIHPCFGKNENIHLSRSLVEGWLPAPILSGEMDGISYRQTAFVAPGDIERTSGQTLSWLVHPAMGVVKYAMQNRSGRSKDVSLNLSFQIHGDAQPEFEIYFVSEGILVCMGDILLAYVIIDPDIPLSSHISGNDIHMEGALPVERVCELSVFIPTWAIAPDDYRKLNYFANPFDSFERYWTNILQSGMQVETPDPLMTDVIKASQVSCLIAARNENEGEFIAPWIASMAYGPLDSEANSIIRGIDVFGYEEFARRTLDFFINRYTPEGYVTPEYTLMGTGWHLWTIGQHFELYDDKEWLRGISTELVRVCDWIIMQCEKTKRCDAFGEKVAEFGLAPAGVIADWNAFAYHFCLNGYYYAGLRAATNALSEIGNPKANDFIRYAEDYRENIRRAYQCTQAITPALPLRNGEWVLGYPSQIHCPARVAEIFPSEDSDRTSAYDVELGAHQLVPQGVLNSDEPNVDGMMEHMEDVAFLSDGWHDYPAEISEKDWFNLGGFSKIQPYYTRNMEIYALQDQVKPYIRSYFNTMASLINAENMTFWEHFNNMGAWNKTHETGYFLLYSRLMMLMERGQELWLAPFVTNNWLREGMRVSVRNAPTRFGFTSYRMESHVKEGYMDVQITNQFRVAPSSLVIRLRHPEGKPIHSVLLNNEPHDHFDGRENMIITPGELDNINIKAEF